MIRAFDDSIPSADLIRICTTTEFVPCPELERKAIATLLHVAGGSDRDCWCTKLSREMNRTI